MSLSLSRLNLKQFLKTFPCVSKVVVKWGDQDAYQHVNNVMYFKYQETSRLQYFSYALDHLDPNQTDFEADKFIAATGVGPILADTYCKFNFPMTFPDSILVGATIRDGDLGKNRYKLTHAIYSLRHDRVVAEGYGTVVTYDYASNKVVDIPAPLRDAMIKGQKLDSVHLLADIEKHAQCFDNEF